ncbi:MAG TPA: MBL fold metallo-hydrolase [Bacteroidota bacterium]
MNRFISIAFIAFAFCVSLNAQVHSHGPLRLEVFVSDSNSYCVTSTLVTGSREAILIDVQFRKSEAEKLADRVAASGKKLKAIVISHPDDDHYLCMAVFKERFPGTPIYMTAAALRIFKKNSMRYYDAMKKSYPGDTPDSLPTPEVLPTKHFELDGQSIEIVEDQQGDVWTPANSYLWIPSMNAVIAGDIVFNGVHVWLANSNRKSRAAWLKTLDQLEALDPKIVIAGHKRDDTTPDGPNVIAATRDYIKAFDAELDNATGSDDLAAIMKHRFKSLSLPGFLVRAARVAIPD